MLSEKLCNIKKKKQKSSFHMDGENVPQFYAVKST